MLGNWLKPSMIVYDGEPPSHSQSSSTAERSRLAFACQDAANASSAIEEGMDADAMRVESDRPSRR